MNKRLLLFSCTLCLSVICISPSMVSADDRRVPSKQMKASAHNDAYLSNQLFKYASALIKQNKVEEGIKQLEMAAHRHHPTALYELASYYELGLGVAKDTRKAITYYQEAIEAGSSDARFNLALLLVKSKTNSNNLAEARSLMTTLAKQGDIEAQYSLSLMYKDALGDIYADPEQSIHWLGVAANAGHTYAQFNLGLHYLKGEQIAKNTYEASLWFNKAAKKGMPRAQFNLALMYEAGVGVAKNKEQSLVWYKSAAKLGSAKAQQNLGIKYLLGEQVAQDNRKALNLISTSAKQHNENAQFLLARLYHIGRNGVLANKPEAEKWYLLSARQGHREAQYQLALLLSQHENSQQAAKYWAYQAAFAGHQQAYLLQAKL